MDDALYIASGAFARAAFCEFLERAGLRDEAIDKVAAHGFGDLTQGRQRDAVGGFGALEHLNVLPRHVQTPTDVGQTEDEGFANRGDPSAGGTREQAFSSRQAAVKLG